MNKNRMDPCKAAKLFCDENFFTSEIVLLGGSVIRGEATDTSDLDIVIIDESIHSAYRESLFAYGWPIEVFVHNKKTLIDFFKSDCERARPSLPRMVAEAVVIKDNGYSSRLKEQAEGLLNEGPPEWDSSMIRMKRYFLTDLLDDFIGSTNHGETIFIAGTLAESLHEFVLRTNRHWIGSSKWIVRALTAYNPVFAEKFIESFSAFYQTGEKGQVISLVDSVLKPYGGRLFEGFSLGKHSVEVECGENEG
ncbi:nucleotidyltransferase domain-containing protein [[Bacillus] enclensis]|uniref:nucleotidyltransferase domain-containing protein n=1 Tax=[Bacillus] enclensis TaxID=1402860 RepID=UPI001E5B3BD7|nr:nucleotidyltransferase domain-containing protein [[Bacillus] enclensis]